MELGTTLVGLSITALCIVPFIMLTKGRKNKEKELINALHSLADQFNCKISECDCGIEFAIGITENKRYVFFYKKRNDVEIVKNVPLNATWKCTINAVKKTVKTQEGTELVTEKLELVFEPKSKHHEIIRFEFYNNKEHFMINDELQLIKKWESLINNYLKM